MCFSLHLLSLSYWWPLNFKEKEFLHRKKSRAVPQERFGRIKFCLIFLQLFLLTVFSEWKTTRLSFCCLRVAKKKKKSIFSSSVIDFYYSPSTPGAEQFISLCKRTQTNVFKLDSFLYQGKKKKTKNQQTNGSNFMSEAEGTDCFCVADVPFT